MIQMQLYYLRMMEPPCLYLRDTNKRLLLLDIMIVVQLSRLPVSVCSFWGNGRDSGRGLPPTMVKEISLLSGAQCLCTQLDYVGKLHCLPQSGHLSIYTSKQMSLVAFFPHSSPVWHTVLSFYQCHQDVLYFLIPGFFGLCSCCNIFCLSFWWGLTLSAIAIGFFTVCT